jgi:hypothetical protein
MVSGNGRMSIEKLRNVLQASEHLRKELSEGATLAELTLKRTSFGPGAYFGVIPENKNQSDLNFGWGISRPSGEPIVFAKMVRSFIDDPDCVVLVEDIDPFSNPFADEEDAPYRTRALTYNGEVYWNISGSDLSENDILELLNQPFPYPSSIFFSTVRSSELEIQLKDSDLWRITDNLVGVAVRAFDGDSFLIWWNENLRPFPAYPSPSSAR